MLAKMLHAMHLTVEAVMKRLSLKVVSTAQTATQIHMRRLSPPSRKQPMSTNQIAIMGMVGMITVMRRRPSSPSPSRFTRANRTATEPRPRWPDKATLDSVPLALTDLAGPAGLVADRFFGKKCLKCRCSGH